MDSAIGVPIGARVKAVDGKQVSVLDDEGKVRVLLSPSSFHYTPQCATQQVKALGLLIILVFHHLSVSACKTSSRSVALRNL